MKLSIEIKTQFEAIHSWPSCDIADIMFLAQPHRHIFYVKVRVPINQDREIEFIHFKREVESYIETNWKGINIGSNSCEAIAMAIMNRFPNSVYISVHEDNENGVILKEEEG